MKIVEVKEIILYTNYCGNSKKILRNSRVETISHHGFLDGILLF